MSPPSGIEKVGTGVVVADVGGGVGAGVGGGVVGGAVVVVVGAVVTGRWVVDVRCVVAGALVVGDCVVAGTCVVDVVEASVVDESAAVIVPSSANSELIVSNSTVVTGRSPSTVRSSTLEPASASATLPCTSMSKSPSSSPPPKSARRSAPTPLSAMKAITPKVTCRARRFLVASTTTPFSAGNTRFGHPQGSFHSLRRSNEPTLGAVDLRIGPTLTIPERCLAWSFGPSGGPGGQHANTSNTRAELVFDIETADCLTDSQRRRLRVELGATVRVVADDTRSQHRNRKLAEERLAARLRDALAPRPQRRATKRTRGSVERRLRAKRQRSERKAQRRRPDHD